MTDKKKKVFKSGMVSIVGRPNVGKSTLLNKLLGQKVSIVSKVPQTTRTQVRAICNDERGQIVFIDTPGLHLGQDKLDKFMNQSVLGSLDEVDCVIYLVDVSRRIGQEEYNVADHLKNIKAPIILAMNKIDMGKNNIPRYISFWEEVKGQKMEEMDNITLLPMSADRDTNVEKLLDLVFEVLPEGPAYYPDDMMMDVPQRMAMADIVREKLFQKMRNEIPHSIGVMIEDVQPRKGKTLLIKALILVERNTQKEIVIGKNGNILKEVGTEARLDLEQLLESKVYLELHVKVQKNWRDNPTYLQELGYNYE